MKNRDKNSVLLVDDETVFHRQMYKAFEGGYWFDSAVTAEQMWEKLKGSTVYDLLILDLRLDGGEKNVGFELIPLLVQRYPQIPIVVATKENDPDAVVQAMELGAKSFLYKGKFDIEKWDKKFQDAIGSAQAPRLIEEVAQLKEEKEAVENEKYPFVGQSTKIIEVQELLRWAANEPNLTVLLTGETGVGKEVAARYLHRHGPRHDKPFVGVNLSAIPHDLLESNLFGHVKGSFTGALKDTKGYFEQAKGGVLLLDEIGDINHDIQVKLLRVLEDRTIQRVGDDKPMKIDVQIVAATHRNLAEEVAKGKFRLDLFQRIKTITIEIPALRERAEDIVPILEYFMRLQIPNAKAFEQMDADVADRLKEYSWPGNIRELKSSVEYMLLRKKMFNKNKIDWNCLPEDIRENRPPFALSKMSKPELPEMPLSKSEHWTENSSQDSPDRKEKQAYADLMRIEEAFIQFEGNKTKVANYLRYKGTDHLRARIITCHKNFPHLFEQFLHIREQYASLIK